MRKGYWFVNSRFLVITLALGLIGMAGIFAGCGGGDDSPSTPSTVEKCLEVGPRSTSGILRGWPVSLKNKATGETLRSFQIIAVAACVNDTNGNQIACWQNAVWEGDQLLSFDATIDGENYNYPADACQ